MLRRLWGNSKTEETNKDDKKEEVVNKEEEQVEHKDEEPDLKFVYDALPITSGDRENSIVIRRKLLHDSMVAYNSTVTNEEYITLLLNDLNSRNYYMTDEYPDWDSWAQWVCECQTKCEKGQIYFRTNTNMDLVESIEEGIFNESYAYIENIRNKGNMYSEPVTITRNMIKVEFYGTGNVTILHSNLEYYKIENINLDQYQAKYDKLIYNAIKYNQETYEGEFDDSSLVPYVNDELKQWLMECQIKCPYKIILQYGENSSSKNYMTINLAIYNVGLPDTVDPSTSLFKIRYVQDVILMGWMDSKRNNSTLNKRLQIKNLLGEKHEEESVSGLEKILEISELDLTQLSEEEMEIYDKIIETRKSNNSDEFTKYWWSNQVIAYASQEYPVNSVIYSNAGTPWEIRYPLIGYLQSRKSTNYGKKYTVWPNDQHDEDSMHTSMEMYSATIDKTIEEVALEDISKLLNEIINKSDSYRTLFLAQWFSECADRSTEKIGISGTLTWKGTDNVSQIMNIPSNSFVGWRLGDWIHKNKPKNKNLTAINLELETQIPETMVDLPLIPEGSAVINKSNYGETTGEFARVKVTWEAFWRNSEIPKTKYYIQEFLVEFISHKEVPNVYVYVGTGYNNCLYRNAICHISYLPYLMHIITNYLNSNNSNTDSMIDALYRYDKNGSPSTQTLNGWIDNYNTYYRNYQIFDLQLYSDITTGFINKMGQSNYFYQKNNQTSEVSLIVSEMEQSITMGNFLDTIGHVRQGKYVSNLPIIEPDQTDLSTIWNTFWSYEFSVFNSDYIKAFLNEFIEKMGNKIYVADITNSRASQPISIMKKYFIKCILEEYERTQDSEHMKQIVIREYTRPAIESDIITEINTLAEEYYNEEYEGQFVPCCEDLYTIYLYLSDLVENTNYVVDIGNEAGMSIPQAITNLGYMLLFENPAKIQIIIREGEVVVGEFNNVIPYASWNGAVNELKDILEATPIDKEKLNQWQYKCMKMNYKNGDEEVVESNSVGSNVTFKVKQSDGSYKYIDNYLNDEVNENRKLKPMRIELDDIEPQEYVIFRNGIEPDDPDNPGELVDGYILTDEDQNEKDGLTYTMLINSLINKYLTTPDMSNNEVSNIITLIETRLSTEDIKAENDSKLEAILDKVSRELDLIVYTEQKYDRDEVLSHYTLQDKERIRSAFDEWMKYYTLSPEEYIKKSAKMIWEEMYLDYFDNSDGVDGNIILSYYNQILKEVYNTEGNWTMDLDDDDDEDEEEELQIMDFTTATDEEYTEMMTEIQGARNRMQRNDNNYKLVLVLGTNYGDLYSVFGKEDGNVPVDTFFRIKRKTSDDTGACLRKSDNKTGFRDLVYIPIDRANDDTDWVKDQWLRTDLYQYIFYPMSYCINDSSPFKGLIKSNTTIRYLGYMLIKQSDEGSAGSKKN